MLDPSYQSKVDLLLVYAVAGNMQSNQTGGNRDLHVIITLYNPKHYRKKKWESSLLERSPTLPIKVIFSHTMQWVWQEKTCMPYSNLNQSHVHKMAMSTMNGSYSVRSLGDKKNLIFFKPGCSHA